MLMVRFLLLSNTTLCTIRSLSRIYFGTVLTVYLFSLYYYLCDVMYRVLEEDYRLFRGYNVTELLEVLQLVLIVYMPCHLVILRVVTGSALVCTHRVHAMPHGQLEDCYWKCFSQYSSCTCHATYIYIYIYIYCSLVLLFFV